MEWVVIGLFIIIVSTLASSSGTAPQPGSVEDLARQAAQDWGVPAWYLLATGQVESQLRALAPTGNGEGMTFYPYGLTVGRARFILGNEQDDDHVLSLLRSLPGQTDLAAQELKRGWDLYEGDDEALRLFWVVPGVAKRGRPWPEMTGSVETSRRLRNWRAAVAKWRTVA